MQIQEAYSCKQRIEVFHYVAHQSMHNNSIIVTGYFRKGFFSAVLLLCMVFTAYCAEKPLQPLEGTTGEIIDSLKHQLTFPLADTVRARTLANISNLVANRSTNESMRYGFETLKLCYKPGLSRFEYMFIKGVGCNSIGLAYERSGKLSLALHYLLKAQECFDHINYRNRTVYARMMNSLGHVYHGLKNNEESEKYYRKAMAIARYLKQYQSVSALYGNIGVVYLATDKRKAIEYFKLSVKEADKLDPVKSNSAALSNLSSTYIELKEYDSAKYYASRALSLGLRDNNLYHQAVSNINLGKIAIKQNRLKDAEAHLNEAKLLADKLGIAATRSEVLDAFRDYYKATKDYKKALENHQRFRSIKDSMLNDKVYQAINDAKIAEEINKRDREIILLNKNKQISGIEIRRETLLRNSLAIGAVLALILLFILYLNARQKRRSNIMLSRKNTHIEKQRHEIEVVNKQLDSFNKELIIENTSAKYEVLKSKTNPHFLFNSMATLSSIVTNDGKLANEYIGRFSELYRRILNTENKSLITLKEEMELVDYYLYIEKMRFEEKLVVNINISDALLNCQLPPFCIQMMVENAIKHNVITNLKPLYLNIYTEDESIYIVNNFQKKHVPVASTSTGQKNISDRYAMLTDIKPLFKGTEKDYVVVLPLIAGKEYLINN